MFCKKYPIKILFFITVMIHGLSLCINGIFWDGVLLHTLYRYHNTQELFSWIHEMGLPVYYYIIRILWFFGDSFVCNIVGFFSIFFTSVFFYKSLCLFKDFPKKIALFSAAILILFPGSLITCFHAISSYYILYTLFFMAVFLGLKHEVSQSIVDKYIFRISALICFFISFSLKSLLCYYLIFYIALYFLKNDHSKKLLFSLKNIFKFAFSKIDFALLPILFWFVFKLFYKPYGLYDSYNSFIFSGFLPVFDTTIRAINQYLLAYLVPIIKVSFLCSIIVGIFEKLRGRQFFSEIVNIKKTKMAIILMFLGSFSILLAIIPYVLVGKMNFYNFLPNTRSLILIPSAVALFFSGFSLLFFLKPNGEFNIVGKLMIIFLIAFYFIFWTKNYLTLNAWAAMRQGFIQKLEQHPEWSKYSLYWITVKEFTIPPAYAEYAWAGYFDQVYGGQSRYAESDLDYLNKIGFSSFIQQFSSQDFRHQYSLANIDPYGCQASVTISPGVTAKNPKSPVRIGLNYLYYSFIKMDEKKLFLDQLMNVEINLHSSPDAKNCHEH